MTCPICQKPTVEEFAPFCSRACKNTDLLRWINGVYKIPTEEPVEDEIEPKDEDEGES